MTALNTADAVYLGDSAASAVYLGTNLIWQDLLVVTDDFNRANGALGTGWQDIVTDFGDTIVSNEAVPSAQGGHAGSYRTETFGDDQYAEVTLGSVPVASGDFTGAMVRAQNNGDDFYCMFYFLQNGNSPGQEVLWLYKRVNNEFSPGQGGFLDAAQQGIAPGTLPPGTVIRLEAQGNRIRVLLDGVQVLGGIDRDHPTGGSPGVFGYSFTNYASLNSFEGGELAPAIATSPASDDFERADSANLGANWTSMGVQPSIVSGKATAGGGANYYAAWTEDGLFNNDQYAEITGISGGGWVGPSVRDTTPGADAYLVIAFGGNVSLYKQLGALNGFTQIGTPWAIPGGTVAPSDVLRIEAEGTTIRGLFNGVVVTTTTDASIPSDGVPGLMLYDTAACGSWTGGNL